MRQQYKITKIDNPTALGIATFTLPRKCKVYTFRAVNGNATAIGDITKVEVIKSNSSDDGPSARRPGQEQSGETVLISLTGRQLDEINLIDNVTGYATANYLKIIFEDNKLKLPGAQYSTAINVGPKETLRVEITTVTTAPAWTAYADIDDNNTPSEFVRRIRAYQKDLAAGDVGTDNVPYGDAQRQYWRRLLIRASAGTIVGTRIVLGTGNTEIYNRLTALNLDILSDLGFTTGAYYGDIIDFAETGVLEPIDLSQYKSGDSNVNVFTNNLTAATNIYILESLGRV